MIPQAIVLTSHIENDAFAPHTTMVAGLNMLERTLAMLQWAGTKEAVVVVGDWDRGRSPAALSRSRVLDSRRMRVRFVTDDGARARGGLSIRPAAEVVREPVVVLSAATVIDRALLRELTAVQPSPGELVSLMDGDHHLGVVTADHQSLTPLLDERFDVALAQAREGVVRRDVAGRFWAHIDSLAAVQRAENDLWNSCRKPHDGIVARLLNRHISLFISRRIAHLPISPNHVSMVTFALGVITALCVLQGTYGYFLLGALLFKANSILDGVDGELARVRYQMSVLGEWLDTVSDDLSNMLFYVALAIGSFRMTGAPLWVTLGFLTAVPSLIATAHQYHLLLRHGRGDLLAIKWLFERGNGKGSESRGFFAAFLDKAKYVVKKDFFVALVLLMAIVGQLPLLLFITATANLVLMATIIAQEVQVYRLARAGKVVERVITDTPGAPPAARPAESGRVPAQATARR